MLGHVRLNSKKVEEEILAPLEERLAKWREGKGGNEGAGQIVDRVLINEIIALRERDRYRR